MKLSIMFGIILIFISVSHGFSQTVFTVTSIGDGSDNNIGDGLCDDGTGDCTLRAAIEEANVTFGKDSIMFNISGTGPHTIQPSKELPAITDTVVIDGYTQPGASPNTNPITLGSNAVLMIEIDGTNPKAGESAFVILAGNSTIRGLVVNRFIDNAILVFNSGISIEGNFIGTDVTGTSAAGNGSGILINSPNNTIGGTTEAARNVISGNFDTGITYVDSTPGNLVQGNFIGTDLTGTFAIGNGTGLNVLTSDNTIGGTSEGARNVISGNLGEGIAIGHPDLPVNSGNLVQGNFIGTDVSGTVALGNGINGILISNSSDNTIGGNVDEANVSAFNTRNGVQIASGTGNNILSNSIFGNQRIGISLRSDGTTQPNDSGDADDGPNNLQNFPDIFSASADTSDTLWIEYYVDSDTTNSDYPLLAQFFIADAGGEGEIFLGEDIFTASDHENGNKTVNLGQVSALEDAQDVFIVATATDFLGNTSQFTSNAELVGIDVEGDILPANFKLFNAFPNPFNPSTTLSYTLPRPANISLIIYNLLGEEVMRWDEERLQSGNYEKIWNGTNKFGIQVSSGIYLYRLMAGDFVQTRKMVLLK